MNEPEGRWTATRKGGSDRIEIRFQSRITTEVGEAVAARFLTLLGEGTVDVTFDVREVTGYDSGARSAWQRLVAPRRDQVRSMRFLGTSSLTRMGATVFSMAIGVPATFGEA